LRQEPHFRERIEDHPVGPDSLYVFKELLNGLCQFYFVRMEDRILFFRCKASFGEFVIVKAIPSSVQPCECATLSSSSLLSDKLM
jgi:hypothetical protein